MPRLTKQEHDGILQNLSNAFNMDETQMGMIGKLRDDYDQSLTPDEHEWQNRYNELNNTYQTDKASYETMKTEYEALKANHDTLEAQYNTVLQERDSSRQAYRDRFFGGGSNNQMGNTAPSGEAPQPQVDTPPAQTPMQMLGFGV